MAKKPETKSSLVKVQKASVPVGWLQDLDALRRVIHRAAVVNRPRKVSFGFKSYPVPDFHVATVSTSISMSDFDEVSTRGYKIYIVKEKRRLQLRNKFLTQLEKAADVGAKLVCFNELAYPTPIDHAQDKRFQEEIMEIVTAANLFLIAGSYHDVKRCYSISPVFAPQVGGSLSHAKLTNAMQVFETLRVPSDAGLRYYETEFGSFTILVGLDLFNPDFVLRLMMSNYAFTADDKIDITFVPSFTLEKSQAMAQACQDLSYLTASLVVYVNCAGNEPRHAVFLAGQPLKTHNGRLPTTKPYSKQISKNVALHRVSYDEYRRSRIDISDSYSPLFTYLIGGKAGVRVGLRL